MVECPDVGGLSCPDKHLGKPKADVFFYCLRGQSF